MSYGPQSRNLHTHTRPDILSSLQPQTHARVVGPNPLGGSRVGKRSSITVGLLSEDCRQTDWVPKSRHQLVRSSSLKERPRSRLHDVTPSFPHDGKFRRPSAASRTDKDAVAWTSSHDDREDGAVDHVNFLHSIQLACCISAE
jgi:hypothetical protein